MNTSQLATQPFLHYPNGRLVPFEKVKFLRLKLKDFRPEADANAIDVSLYDDFAFGRMPSNHCPATSASIRKPRRRISTMRIIFHPLTRAQRLRRQERSLAKGTALLLTAPLLPSIALLGFCDDLIVPMLIRASFP